MITSYERGKVVPDASKRMLICEKFNVNPEWLENGGDLFTLQRQMGHTDLQMTKRYTEISDKLLVECHQNYSLIGLLQDSSRRVKV